MPHLEFQSPTPPPYTKAVQSRRKVYYRSCVFVPRPILSLCAKESEEPVSYYDDDLKMQIDFNVPDPTSGRVGPVFTIDHLRCLAIILALPHAQEGSTLTSRSTFAAIFRGSTADTNTKQQVSQLLGDLHNTWCRRSIQLPNGETEELHFKILEAFNIRTRRAAGLIRWRQWEALRVNPHFLAVSDGLARSGKGKAIPIFLPAFLAITSDIAAKLYLYLAAPAYFRKEHDPFRVLTATLWEKLHLPTARYASVRKKILTQNAKSILSQIDGAFLSRGKHRLRLKLEASNSGDFNLLAWSEPVGDQPDEKPEHQPVSKFKAAWLRSGKTDTDFRRAITPMKQLDEHDRETLSRGGINPEPCLTALRIAKSILPVFKWNELLAEAKNDQLEQSFRSSSERTREPVRLLMYRLIEAVSLTPS